MMEEQANRKTRKQARADEAGTMYRRVFFKYNPQSAFEHLSSCSA